MSNPPLVSLVTPAYNQGSFLRETILSVLSQDYPAIEYVVIDDGSTDNTAEVIAEFSGRLRAISRENKGQAATLNEGWSLCKGKYLGYLSSDDLLDPSAISSLVSVLERNESAVVAYSDFRLIDSSGCVIREVRVEDFHRRRLIEDLVCQPGPGAIFKKSVFDKTGGWDAALRQVPDFEFWTRVSAHGDFMRIPRVNASCRVHEASASFRSLESSRCDEILNVVSSPSYPIEPFRRSVAMSKAHLVAARRHLNSTRFITALDNIYQALIYMPSIGLRPETWRLIAAGCLRRPAHGLLSFLGLRAK